MLRKVHTYAATVNGEGHYLVGAKSKRQARRFLKKTYEKDDIIRILYKASDKNGQVPEWSRDINADYGHIISIF